MSKKNHNKNDNLEYLVLQEKYLKNRKDEKTLGQMMVFVYEISIKLTKKYLNKNKLHLDIQDVEDIASNTMTRILKRYKTNSTWRMETNPIGSIYFDWFKTITKEENLESLQQKFECNMQSWEEYMEKNYMEDGETQEDYTYEGE